MHSLQSWNDWSQKMARLCDQCEYLATNSRNRLTYASNQKLNVIHYDTLISIYCSKFIEHHRLPSTDSTIYCLLYTRFQHALNSIIRYCNLHLRSNDSRPRSVSIPDLSKTSESSILQWLLFDSWYQYGPNWFREYRKNRMPWLLKHPNRIFKICNTDCEDIYEGSEQFGLHLVDKHPFLLNTVYDCPLLEKEIEIPNAYRSKLKFYSNSKSK